MAASFDCSKASNPYEKAVCANPTLSSLDDQLAVIYKNARAKSADPEALKKTQIDWIKATRQCASDTSCIEKAYKDRMIALGGSAQPQQPVQAVAQTKPTTQPNNPNKQEADARANLKKLFDYGETVCKAGDRLLASEPNNENVKAWKTLKWGKGYSYCFGLALSVENLNGKAQGLDKEIEFIDAPIICDLVEYKTAREAFTAGWTRIRIINSIPERNELFRICQPLMGDLQKIMKYRSDNNL